MNYIDNLDLETKLSNSKLFLKLPTEYTFTTVNCHPEKENKQYQNQAFGTPSINVILYILMTLDREVSSQ